MRIPIRSPRPGKPLTYRIRFYLEGLDDCLIYEVEEKEYDRIRKNLDGSDELFCCFETLNSVHVAISLQSIELVNFLWDPAELRALDGGQDKGYNILIRYKTRCEPYCCYTDDPEGVADLFFHLDAGFTKFEPFESFWDEDNEEVVIDARKVLYIEASSELVNEGNVIMEEKMGITEGVEEEQKKPKKVHKRPAKRKK